MRRATALLVLVALVSGAVVWFGFWRPVPTAAEASAAHLFTLALQGQFSERFGTNGTRLYGSARPRGGIALTVYGVTNREAIASAKEMIRKEFNQIPFNRLTATFYEAERWEQKGDTAVRSGEIKIESYSLGSHDR